MNLCLLVFVSLSNQWDDNSVSIWASGINAESGEQQNNMYIPKQDHFL